MWFKSFVFLSFFLLSCTKKDSLEVHLLSTSPEKSEEDFLKRKDQDQNRDQILKALEGRGETCQKQELCQRTCEKLFSLDYAKKSCLEVPGTYIYQIEKAFSALLKKDFNALKDFSAFHLSIFLNLSPRSFYLFLRSLDHSQKEELLHWIVEDITSEVARIFYEEDWDFLLLESLFQENQVFPLELTIKDQKGLSFIQKALSNQNTYALNWIHDFFSKSLCLDKGPKCVLTQYCHLMPGDFHPSHLDYLKKFGPLSKLLKEHGDSPCPDTL